MDPLVLQEGYYIVLSRLRVSSVVSEEECVLMSGLFDPSTYVKFNSTVLETDFGATLAKVRESRHRRQLKSLYLLFRPNIRC